MEFVIIIVILGAAIFLIVEGGLPIVPSTAAQKIAKAIARAEGFYAQGSLPQRANNPGNLERGDIGYGMISGKTIYPSPGQGWNALYAQVQAMLDGSSQYYDPTMTISDIAPIYTGNDNSISWAQNVADSLGVDVDTPIGQIA